MDELCLKFAERVKGENPVFAVSASQIEMLDDPSVFYTSIIGGIRRARKRILISSLYIGTGPKEAEIVAELCRRMGECKSLSVCLLFDYHRMSRDETPMNGLDMLAPLLSMPRCKVFCFASPSLNPSSFVSQVLPYRVRECFGVQHSKVVVFDDDVIITGANLSEQYFTNRVDRYHRIKSSEKLARYFEQLFGLITSISFQLTKSADTPHFKEMDEKSFIEFRKNLELLNSSHQLDPQEKHPDTIVVPSIQLAALEIYNDQCLLDTFLTFIDEHFHTSTAFFATGYFNPANTILQHILKSRSTWKIVTSSPSANTFYKSKGLTGFIPSIYRTNLITACDYLSNNKSSTPSLFEYTKPNWTYHAKGILVTDNSGKTAYVIGSSNFGERSFTKDLEIQVYVMSSNPALGNSASKEFGRIVQECKQLHKPFTVSSFDRILARLVRSFL